MKILIVGAGLYGAVMAALFIKDGHSVDVIDKRSHIGGNCYSEKMDSIDVHRYGPHIFHTSCKEVWDFITDYAEFEQFNMTAKAMYGGRLYSFPINLQTINEVFGVQTPNEAIQLISGKTISFPDGPRNIEDVALEKVGIQLYNMFIKDYVKKQWGRPARDLPAFIINRLPVRFTYNPSYYNDAWVGIPKEGYTALIGNMLSSTTVMLNKKYDKRMETAYDKIIYTGPIDEFFEHRRGHLEYRSLKFEFKTYNMQDYQGIPMIAYPEEKYPFTRKVEYKYFLKSQEYSMKTVVSTEYPSSTGEPYYPVNDKKNNDILTLYKKDAKEISDRFVFGGRLGSYTYLDMDKAVYQAMQDYKTIN